MLEKKKPENADILEATDAENNAPGSDRNVKGMF